MSSTIIRTCFRYARLRNSFKSKSYVRYMSSKKDILSVLQERNLIHNKTFDIPPEKIVVYSGVDPTAESLHLGNLVQIMVLLHFKRCGHDPIALIGGATGMIGDPSGRSTERQNLERKIIEKNVSSIKKQVNQLWDRLCDELKDINNSQLKIVDNYEWYSGMNVLDFLSNVGRLMRIGPMLSRESVKSRMEGEGISFTEFSYQLLQAYDFYRLSLDYKVNMQFGGSDQWGNIVSGIDLIHKSEHSHQTYGLTVPLLTTNKGEKFGKSAGNAIWLNPLMTTPYEFYQFFLNVNDDDIRRLLLTFTFLDITEIDSHIQEHFKAPNIRHGQKILADEVTRLVHGEKSLKISKDISAIFFSKQFMQISIDMVNYLSGTPGIIYRLNKEIAFGRFDKLAVITKVFKTRTEAKRVITSGAASINAQINMIPGYELTSRDFGILEGSNSQYTILRFGKVHRIIIIE